MGTDGATDAKLQTSLGVLDLLPAHVDGAFGADGRYLARSVLDAGADAFQFSEEQLRQLVAPIALYKCQIQSKNRGIVAEYLSLLSPER
jgi:hypothetical protein